MKIQPTSCIKREVQRTLTLAEFTYLAKTIEVPAFNELRQLGKTSNFTLLFSASARTFSNTLTKLSPVEATKLVDNLNLRGLQQKLISKGKVKSHELRDQYFLDRLTLATFIRAEFHKAYPGLAKLAEARRKEAESKGYVRCVHGAVRRLPQMMLKGKNDHGNKEMFSLFSIAINSPVQNFESVTVSYYTVFRLWEWLVEHDMRSRIFNFVHDSFDLYIDEKEATAVLAKARELAEETRPEHEGLSFTVSGTVGDYHNKGELWKDGADFKDFL